MSRLKHSRRHLRLQFVLGLLILALLSGWIPEFWPRLENSVARRNAGRPNA